MDGSVDIKVDGLQIHSTDIAFTGFYDSNNQCD
jgi:hypothetical protein